MDKYLRAQERIDGGLWFVDADAGVVHNRHGKLLGGRTWSGYVFLTMTPASGGRGNQNCYAHRVIWESVHGRIPDGLQVNHINGIKSDNRISNLELVTPSGNQIHAHRTGLKVNAKGEAHPRAKLTSVLVADIRRRAAGGEYQHEIAARVGVSRQHVGRIVRGERWAA